MDELFNSVLQNIIKALQSEQIGFGKTRLIKIAYLVELEYYRRHQKRLTGVEWVYYKYGPYVMDYEEYLKNYNIELNDGDSHTQVSLFDDSEVPKLPQGVSLIIEHLVQEHGLTDLNELLDYVYFDTEPMMKAKERFETLDFSVAESISYYKVRELKLKRSDKQQLLKELREKKSHAKPI